MFLSILLDNYISEFVLPILLPLLWFYEIILFLRTSQKLFRAGPETQKRKLFVSKQGMFRIYFWWFHYICDKMYVRPMNIVRIGQIL